MTRSTGRATNTKRVPFGLCQGVWMWTSYLQTSTLRSTFTVPLEKTSLTSCTMAGQCEYEFCVNLM